jgi:hypothetical protein
MCHSLLTPPFPSLSLRLLYDFKGLKTGFVAVPYFQANYFINYQREIQHCYVSHAKPPLRISGRYDTVRDLG